jgi:alpha-tubulin suppressor-like RCC1 family protein
MNTSARRILLITGACALALALAACGGGGSDGPAPAAGDTTPGAPLSSTVAAGQGHTLFVTEAGTVRAIGENGDGQLGDATTTDRTTAFVTVVGLNDVKAVAAGYEASYALKRDGTVWSWGANDVHQLGDGGSVSRSVPVPVLGLPAGIVAIAAGGHHGMALAADGRVWTWGLNNHGQIGDGTGLNRGTAVQVPNLDNVTHIAGGALHSLALRSDGSVWAWGDNERGQLGLGHTSDRSSPQAVPGLDGLVTSIAAGCCHSAASLADGTARAWGYNAWGQLGDGSFVSRTLPVTVGGLTGVASVHAGGDGTFARMAADASLRAWGDNRVGQLGNGVTSATGVSSPVVVQGLIGVRGLSIAVAHSIAFDAEGRGWAWGGNGNGRLGTGNTMNVSAPANAFNGVRTTE